MPPGLLPCGGWEGKEGPVQGSEYLIVLFFFLLFRTVPVAYGGSQAGGQIRAVAASHSHSHSNVGSKLRLRPTPQLTATLDP